MKSTLSFEVFAMSEMTKEEGGRCPRHPDSHLPPQLLLTSLRLLSSYSAGFLQADDKRTGYSALFSHSVSKGCSRNTSSD